MSDLAHEPCLEEEVLGFADDGDDLDLDLELQRLAEVLKSTKEKFVGQWMGTQVKKIIQEKTRTHEQHTTKANDELKSLEGELQQLKELNKDKMKAKSARAQEVHKMTTELSQLQQKTDRLLMEKEEAQRQLRQAEQDLIQQREELSAQRRAADQTSSELEKTLSMYRTRLGLNMRKITGDRLQLVFTCIDQKDPSRQFCFCIRINTDRSYQVSDCIPEVPGYDELVEKLNKTNNLQTFIIRMRQKFKEIS